VQRGPEQPACADAKLALLLAPFAAQSPTALQVPGCSVCPSWLESLLGEPGMDSLANIVTNKY